MNIRPAQKYKHFKGGEYTIITIAKDSDDPERMLVIYQNNGNQNIWAREMSNFCEEVDRPELNYKGPRFIQL